ncbi:phosphotransferase [Candidatus Woesearchaeota archaeon]|nr:phosphotransferase [Candidatus Woesearchaeota archaeon]
MRELLQDYNLGKIHSSKHIKTGVFNKHYILNTTKGKFVARISNKTRTYEEVMYEVQIIQHVQEEKVPMFIKNKKGEYLTQRNGEIIVVSKYVSGKFPTKVTDEMLRETGGFLGRFHASHKTLRMKYRRPKVYVITKSRLENMRKDLKKKLPKLADEIEYVYSLVKKYQFPKSFPHGPCHLDMKPENALAKNGEITLFLDFDNCEEAPYLLDIGRTLKWWCYDKKGYSKRKINILLSEYEKYRLLTTREKKKVNESIILAIVTQLLVIYHLFLYAWDGHEEYLHFYRDLFLPQLKLLLAKE